MDNKQPDYFSAFPDSFGVFFEAIAAALIITDAQGKIQCLNSGAAVLTGYSKEELINNDLSLVMSEAFAFEATEVDSRSRKNWAVLKSKSGDEIPVYYDYGLVRDKLGNVVNIVYLAQDIREYKATEEELIKAYKTLIKTEDKLIQSEKMAAIGRLASGIAHEIRNPLSIIIQGVHFLDNLLKDKGQESKEAAQIIRKAADRIEIIITNLLGYSRAPGVSFADNNICDVIDDGLAMVMSRIGLENIRIEKDYPAAPVILNSDRITLSQVFLNLANNAIDAMSGGGKIFIKVSVDGQFCLIEFTDTGEGIVKKDVSRIFEPFYTTKRPGKGTGLGLSMVHLIIERHKGTIEVDTQINKGARFMIRLPIVKV